MDSSALTTKDLIAFYEGTGTDRRGRSLSQILRWSAVNLERHHDYIQTVFPLPERSAIDWYAPVIDSEVFEAFRSRSGLKDNLTDAFKKILWFYGFELGTDAENKPIVKKGSNYQANPKVWNHRFDHNHLRISRIIRSLRVLGLEDEAVAFYNALSANSTGSNSQSREFWRRAAFRSLNLRPDLEDVDDSDRSIGPKFLRDFEEERNLAAADAEEEQEEDQSESS
ncbi:hypothetical protein G7Y89_g9860 [Cudoniella acicularis]|uniref:Opioid growth factor receptor (OGFr) conserved domain-containing protein n=1 Tax=Cudoniella acicularis TaxID=354080 RepID=A0A8H4RDV4_9HELO|nr:hypothetical protein G7Y89_g9860 [Cudoniella acicularis]